MSQQPSKSNKKTWGTKIHTINDIYGAQYPSTATPRTSSPSHFRVQHIPNLPDADHAFSLLRRIQSEFQLIVEKRNYVLTTVTEMCCCEDGLDHLQLNSGKRRRKTRRMPNNVLGYNLTQGSRNGNSVHRIHLRLRHPTKHTFYPYDDIAGTMCHELAHCERGPHDAKFYKLMDEIMEQYAVFMVRGLVVDKSGFPMGSDNAHVLGGDNSRMNGNNQNARARAAQNRMERQKTFGGSFRLGGGFMPGTSNSSSSLAQLPPAEAARRAAERRVEERRNIDSLFCLPCQEVIEILDGSSCDEKESDEKKDSNEYQLSSNRQQKRVSAKIKPKKSKMIEIVVLDSDSDLSDNEDESKSPSNTFAQKQTASAKQTVVRGAEQSDSSDVECSSWSCPKCTYSNEPNFIACEVCGHRPKSIANREAKATAIRNRAIEEVKTNEAERSKRDFGGFNIYGNTKESSRTMEHLT